MEKNNQHKGFVFSIIALLIGASFIPFVSSEQTINNNEVILSINADEPIVEVSAKNSVFETEMSFEIKGYLTETINIDNQEYIIIKIEDESNIHEKGCPDLPDIRRSIIIPDDTEMDFKVKYLDYQEFNNVYIAPSKGILSREVDPSSVPYEFDQTYNENKWYPSSLVELGEPYILRDFRGIVVKVNPFQYNPVTKVLRFYSEVIVDIEPVGDGEINVLDRPKPITKLDYDYDLIYSNHFMNYENFDYSIINFKFPEFMKNNPPSFYTPVSEKGNMLVICYDDFMNAMEPFVTWKNMKGVPTELVKLSDVGTTSDDIDSYIESYYNSNGLTFVLLVGDADQMPVQYSSGYASDTSYGYISGGDHYAELFVGRFSAEDITQVETQVERSVEYEKNPQMGAGWYHKGTGIASSQGTGDEGEYDYEHLRNIRTLLMGYTYTLVDELYDGSQGGEDASGNPSDTMVADALNDGRSIVNYCGHGSTTSWGTSGFSNSDVNALVNDNMLPFIVSVACVNGAFVSATCFGEAWLRATHNGEPTGAIGAYMSTKSQSWSPPMDAQDEFNDILIESYPNNIRHTYGALCFQGAMHMNDNYGSSGYVETDAWTIFGDPSLQIRTDEPGSMNVIHDDTMETTAESFQVTVNGIEDALCAISRDGDLLGFDYTDSSGHATIEFDGPIGAPGTVDLVVTAYNKEVYIAQIEVLSVDFSWTPDYPNTNSPIQFSDQTLGNIYSWLWDFDDGSTSTEQNPSHIFTSEGSYFVTLTVTKDSGDKSITKEVKVKDNWMPISIAYPESYAGNQISIDFEGDESWDPDGTISSYFWNFDDGHTSSQMSPTHSFNQDGIYDVTLKVTDDNGGTNTDHCDIKIDAYTPPETIVDFLGESGNNGWYKGNLVRVSFIATDWSGVDYTMYRIGNGLWTYFDQPGKIWADGSTIVEFYSVDIYGNVEDVKTATLNKDSMDPEVILEMDGEQQGNWYTSEVTIDCSITDDLSGPDSIEYSLNAERWRDYISPIIINEDGEHFLRIKACDLAGNEMFYPVTGPIQIPVDIEPPVTNCNLDGTLEPEGYYSGEVTITLTAEDMAGVDSTYYRIDGGTEWNEYTEPIIISKRGSHDIDYYSLDVLGREEEPKSTEFQIGALPTIPTIDGPTDGKANEEQTWTVSSTHPEETTLEFFVDWGDGETTDWFGPYSSGEEVEITHTYTEKKVNTLRVKARDQWGGESDWGTFEFSTPKVKREFNSIIFEIIKNIFERFPIFEKIFHFLFIFL